MLEVYLFLGVIFAVMVIVAVLIFQGSRKAKKVAKFRKKPDVKLFSRKAVIRAEKEIFTLDTREKLQNAIIQADKYCKAYDTCIDDLIHHLLVKYLAEQKLGQI